MRLQIWYVILAYQIDVGDSGRREDETDGTPETSRLSSKFIEQGAKTHRLMDHLGYLKTEMMAW